MTFPSRLRALRRERHLTQEELGEYIRYSDTAIRKWELGQARPNIEVAAELAEFFNVSLDWLVGLTDMRRPPD